MSKKNRAVTERWFIEGTLELVTPTSLSNGDDDPLVDLPIVLDPQEGRALLTGASLAGALRSYLADCDPAAAVALFGGVRGDSEGAQSALIVDDALGGKPGERPHIELRDGVSIDPATRTARDKERYDRQLLAAGTTFGLGFELVLTAKDNETDMKSALAAALGGLQRGEIRLGGRKRRGYGQCRVTGWRVWRYDLGTPAGIGGWLAHGREGLPGHQSAHWQWTTVDGGRGIGQWDALKDVEALGRQTTPFTLSAEFAVDGAVLIRHGFEAESGPDVMHLTSRRDGKDGVPVMSGTSLAGVIRAQALRIARTLAGPNRDRADAFIDAMFGAMQKPRQDMTREERRKLKKIAGRVTVDESAIAGQTDLVQTRVKIDRFTGGAFESALFAEQPAFGGGFTMKLALRPTPPPKPPDKEPDKMTSEERAEYDEKVKAHQVEQDAEVGLLLLVLKDLWTGFLPVGGSSSVGRGRLKGKSAVIAYGGAAWTLEAGDADGDSITVSPPTGAAATKLNEYVTAFTQQMTGRA